jgi:hypothetical protein
LFGFDFRYHALSLIAVLIALAVGLLLGVAIGDKGLVSSAENNLRASLRSQVHHYQEQVSTLNGQLSTATDVERQLYSVGVRGQLQNERIGVIALGGLPSSILSDTIDALQGSGGTVHSKSVVSVPLNLDALGNAARGTRYQFLSLNPQLVQEFGRRIGVQMTDGGGLLQNVSGALLTGDSNGQLNGMDAIVLYRDDPSNENLDDQQSAALNSFEQGLVQGLSARGVPVVGVQESDTSPSQIDWYKQMKLSSSVDDIDEITGQISLVYALAGVNGYYGTRSGGPAVPQFSTPTAPANTTTGAGP